ncbi:hydrogenase expression/formation protein HypE [Desulfitispora alkaliphila]|uniref:hydrogenase expression/formation protein HypE n=1 Tax=Desulfitispora alkaliphila TaxID=622674 RepID=UPI003D231263
MDQDKISLAHGSGGKLSQELIEEVIYPAFNKNSGNQLLDGAILENKNEKLVMTTDSFVISPIFFPGGDIGKLAVCGTVNDLAVSGAEPAYLSVGFIIEAGFPMEYLKQIVESIAKTALSAKVKIVTGDTKVVETGSADGIFINTTGVGFAGNREYSPSKMEPGDFIIVTGTLGDHGMTILSLREELGLESNLKSDCAPLNHMLSELWKADINIKCMRDPTRGGVATTINELAQQGQVGVKLFEEKLPVRKDVAAGCSLLGLDPVYMANEGKALIVVKENDGAKAIDVLKKNKLGSNSEIIGQVVAKDRGKVTLETSLGIERILTALEGEHLPRIC